MGYDLGGRTVILPGAASGIGAALARVFAAHGCRLILIDRNGARKSGAMTGPDATVRLIATASARLIGNTSLMRFMNGKSGMPTLKT